MDEAAWEERIRAGVDAFNRGSYEAVLEMASEDAQLQRGRRSPDSHDVIKGRDELIRFFQPEVFEDQRSEVRGVEFGDKAVVAKMFFSARGAGSGIPVEIESFVVFRIAGDVFTRMEIYDNESEARAAAGIEPAA